MKRVTIILGLFVFSTVHSQTTGNPNTGDAYLLFGPNTDWGQYLKVGGNGRGTTHASVVATNGNLHLDSRNGSYATYINHYSLGKTLLNPQGGNVGIGTTNPGERFQIGNAFAFHDGGDDYLAFRSSYSDFGQSGWNYLEDGKSAFGISGTGNIHFRIASGAGKVRGDAISWLIPMTLTTDGNVGIGTTSPDSKLTVKGNIHAEEVKVDLSVPGPDYVFKEDYDLKSLEEIQDYINEHGHLPNIPSAKEMEENGVQLGEMNMKLLEKIEELTLYLLEQKAQIDYVMNQNSELKKELSELKTKMQ